MNPPQRSIQVFVDTFNRMRSELGRVIVGHEEHLELILIAFFAGGHVLIEGLPGTGKTLIVRSLGELLNLSFARVQFTIDLMPADITGTRILIDEGGQRTFRFQPGPLFTHVLLADEINRATPKTQSALLEAMAELQVTVAGQSYPLPRPFFVLATLNPIEMEGTYPLPEAQLDRFFFKVVLRYPTHDELRRILARTTGESEVHLAPLFEAAVAAQEIERLRALVRQVMAAPRIESYAAALVQATMPSTSKFVPAGDAPLGPDEKIDRYVSFGASPRGGQALLLGAKVRALLDGRVHVTYDDIDAVAVPALSHRMVVNFAALAEGIEAGSLVEGILERARRLRA
ncbi:MAG: MoxR family ATPase [Candidatus Binatia bacterium]|nr:MoxR family ATPase [Candidatus Binatia bacterium]